MEHQAPVQILGLMLWVQEVENFVVGPGPDEGKYEASVGVRMVEIRILPIYISPNPQDLPSGDSSTRPENPGQLQNSDQHRVYGVSTNS